MKPTTRFNVVILDDAYGRARAILELNRGVLEEGSRALLTTETLDETEIAQLRSRLRALPGAELGRAA